jgi:hypothetical protein
MKLTAFGLIAGLLLPAILCVSTMEAAETVPWLDVPKKIGHTKVMPDCSITTKAGQTYHGRQLTFSPVDVRIDSGPAIPREQVAEIRIRRHESWPDAFFAPAGKIVGEGWILLTPLALPLIPVLIGVTVAAAPVVFVIEGVKRLRPAKVIRVAP